MRNHVTRRGFMRSAEAGSAALAWLSARRAPEVFAAEADKPALLGGAPVHKGGWQSWPVWKPEWEAEMLKVCRSGKWNQAAGGNVADFQARWAELLGAKRCLATSSGTTALITNGAVTSQGNITVKGDGSAATELRFTDAGGVNMVSFKAPNTLTITTAAFTPAWVSPVATTSSRWDRRATRRRTTRAA